METKVQSINDKDLVELAGKYAYSSFDIEQSFKVHDIEYIVLDVNYEHESGLDAFTVVAPETNEVIVLFAGTDPTTLRDLYTDAQLITDLTPDQLTEADRYFKEMDKEYNVSYVVGNSLAGALTSYVLEDRADVKGVTLNPAILPIGVMDPDKNYNHITNYFSKYDFLTKSEMALGIDDRIPGKRYTINNGLPLIELMLSSNHAGYINGLDEYGNPKEQPSIKIGAEGQPGFGEIYIEADEHIVTSIWTGKPLYEQSSQRIEINKENIDLLGSALEETVSERLSRAFTYIDLANEIVVAQKERKPDRVERLQQIFEESFEHLVHNPMFISLATTGVILKNHINELLSLVDAAEDKIRSLNYLLNSPPMELLEFVFQKDISVESITGGIRQPLEQMKQVVDDITYATYQIIHHNIPELFNSEKNAFFDAVVDELYAHFQIVTRNKSTLQEHLNTFRLNVVEVGRHFESSDKAVGDSIRNQTTHNSNNAVILPTDSFKMELSHYLVEKMHYKQIHLDAKYQVFKSASTSIAIPLLELLHRAAALVESGIEVAISTISSLSQVGIHTVFSKDIFGLFDSYKRDIQLIVNDILNNLYEIERMVEGVRKSVGDLSESFPDLIETFKAYVDVALFDPGEYLNVQLYKTAALAIVEEMDLLFSDIITQLSGQQAKAIERLCENANEITGNMKIFHEQISRGTTV